MEIKPLKISSVDYIKSGTRREHFPHDGLPQIAFVGKSNVGKSSLLNVLVNRKRLAHVSSTPGRTQLVNFFLVNGNSYFVDLPGYGFAKAPKSVQAGWEKMITGYLKGNADLAVVVALFDIRREFTEEDDRLLAWMEHFEIPFITVITKADKLTRAKQAEAVRKMQKVLERRRPLAVQLFSADTRQGRDELLSILNGILTARGEAK